MKVATIIDSRGRTRKVTYRYKYQDLLPGKAFYVADTSKHHSVRVLVARWNRINTIGAFLSTKLTKTGRLKVTRFR
jgi:hypothetical protein